MSTKQNVEPNPAAAPQQAENPKPAIAERKKSEIRFPLPPLCPRNEHEEEILKVFLVIVRRDIGCMTPIEQFLTSLIYLYGRRSLTPDGVQSEFKTLTDDWDDAVDVARLFAREHPELLAASGTE